MGVLQVINNKRGGTFTKKEESIISSVAGALAVAFYNQQRIKRRPGKFDLLLNRNVISENDLNKVVEQARKNSKDPIRGDVVSALVNDFNVPRKVMGEALAEYYQTEFMRFDDSLIVPGELVRGLNEKYLRNQFWIPLGKTEEAITVLTDDPANTQKNRGHPVRSAKRQYPVLRGPSRGYYSIYRSGHGQGRGLRLDQFLHQFADGPDG